jgi:hypothetical protein
LLFAHGGALLEGGGEQLKALTAAVKVNPLWQVCQSLYHTGSVPVSSRAALLHKI